LMARGWVKTIEGPDAGREVVETGEVFEVGAVATAQDLTQVVEAVDGLFDGGEGAGCRALAMFYHPVVLESGDVTVVVSMRRMSPSLSEILIEDLPKRCLTQVPSMRVANWLPISWASWPVIL
jgi:hypothetical protein